MSASETGTPDPRLYLIAPEAVSDSPRAALLQRALGAGDVAAVLLRIGTDAEPGLRDVIAMVQSFGAAALIEGTTAEDSLRLARGLGADGLHWGPPVSEVVRLLKGKPADLAVGAGGFATYHEAMLAAEAGADYVLFGRLDRIGAAPHPRALEDATWWAETFEIPAVVVAGSDLETLPEAVATGAEFIALGDAVWGHPDGPDAAVRQALGTIIVERTRS